MHCVGAVLVELGVRNAGASCRELNVAPVHAVEAIALAAFCALLEHRVPVRQLAGQQVAENLEVSVGVGWETRVGLHAVLIEDPQRPEVTEPGVVPVGKGK